MATCYLEQPAKAVDVPVPMLDTTQVLPPELMDVRTSPEVIPPLHPVNASVTAHVALDPFAPAAPATIRNVAVAGIHEPAFQTPDWQNARYGLRA